MSETTTIWVCVDCIIKLANNEDPDRGPAFADEPAPWAELPDADVTPGMLREEHEPGCDPDEECACELRSFSWFACDGCGSRLGGERHACTLWED